MEQTPQEPVISISNPPQSLLKKFFCSKRIILVAVIILIVIVAGYIFYRWNIAKNKPLTDQQKIEILDDLNASSQTISNSYTYSEKRTILDNLQKDSQSVPSSKLSDDEKFKILQAL